MIDLYIIVFLAITGTVAIPILTFVLWLIYGGRPSEHIVHKKTVEPWYEHPMISTGPITDPITEPKKEDDHFLEKVTAYEIMDDIWNS